jgi:hypothetical protein
VQNFARVPWLAELYVLHSYEQKKQSKDKLKTASPVSGAQKRSQHSVRFAFAHHL